MFYCRDCKDENDWPETFSLSTGTCEACGKFGACYDGKPLPLKKNRDLPEPTKGPTELVGRCFVWEPLNANSLTMLVVVSVTLNADQEWWVETADLVTGELAWNELSRFDEATRLNGTQVGELIRNDETRKRR